MASLLTAVKSKMFIVAHRKARGMLEGEYGAIFHGRSQDFEDLRGYVPGDEIRDIDWKATARTGSPLIKRYIAMRSQQLLFVSDSGRNMAAQARGGELKKDIAVMAMGVIGLLAIRHGDSVALVHGDGENSIALPAKGTEAHLEQLLKGMDGACMTRGPSQLCSRLEYVAAHYKQRMLLVVVADELTAEPRLAKVLRRLCAQHEILWLQIQDATLAGPEAVSGVGVDVAGMDTVLMLLAKDPDLARSYFKAVALRAQELETLLGSCGIAISSVAATTEVVAKVFTLLERHRRGR